MKIRITVAIISALVAMSAWAEVYKCDKGGKSVYQSKPCDLGAPDKHKLNVKYQTPEEQAAAKAKLQEIEASNAERKEKDEKAAKIFENGALRGAAKVTEVQRLQVLPPGREANSPAMGVVPAYAPAK